MFAEFTDPRLVALYDTVCPMGEDRIFYLELVAELDATTIVDIGCGTGLLACELARRGLDVTGVDPARPMLEVARNRPGGDGVRWIEGDASQVDVRGADLVIMTAHVAQIITDDAGWRTTLDAAHHALRTGGHVAFESRDPGVQAWGAGKAYASRRRFEDPVIGSFEVWEQIVETDGDMVRSELHYLLAGTGEELVSACELRFRTQQELTGSLTGAGFGVDRVYGNWDRRPVGPGTPELIYVAVRS
jgi:SAM-dependent methyltransferase